MHVFLKPFPKNKFWVVLIEKKYRQNALQIGFWKCRNLYVRLCCTNIYLFRSLAWFKTTQCYKRERSVSKRKYGNISKRSCVGLMVWERLPEQNIWIFLRLSERVDTETFFFVFSHISLELLELSFAVLCFTEYSKNTLCHTLCALYKQISCLNIWGSPKYISKHVVGACFTHIA